MAEPDVCPDGCGRPLALAHAHCRAQDRTVPCGWVRCDCGAVITPDGHFYPRPTTDQRKP